MRKSFTLIELLIVVAIIGVLAGILFVSIGQEPLRKARDAKRLNDMKSIQSALILYLQQNGPWPAGGEGADGCGGWDESAKNTFIDWLRAAGYFPSVPRDPRNNGNCTTGFNYRFYVYDAGYAGCDPARGRFYVLGINALESSMSFTSPGWSCPTRNWQAEFTWVTGAFEN